jgi:hypothetical protein
LEGGERREEREREEREGLKSCNVGIRGIWPHAAQGSKLLVWIYSSLLSSISETLLPKET